MRITAVKPAVKTIGRYNIFVDGAYRFSLDEAQLVAERMRSGLEIDEVDLRRLIDLSEFGKHYARMRDICLRRPHSIKELRDYGKRKQWDSEEVEALILRLQAAKFADDTAFAQFWVRSRLSTNTRGPSLIVAELAQKGIGRELAQQTLSEMLAQDPEAADDRLATLIEKKRTKYPDTQKLIAYLMRRGYRYDDIQSALSPTDE
jgi:regulatory protein